MERRVFLSPGEATGIARGRLQRHGIVEAEISVAPRAADDLRQCESKKVRVVTTVEYFLVE